MLTAGSFLFALLLPALASAQTATNLWVYGNEFRGVTRPGDLFRIQVTASRNGSGVGVNPFVEIALPPELEFIALSFQRGSADCATPASGSSGVIRCLLPMTVNFSSEQMNIDLRVAGTAAIGSIPITRVVAGSDVPDPTPGDNTAEFRTLVQSGAEQTDLRVRIEAAPDPVAPGALLTHRIILENPGPDTTAWVSLSFFQPSARLEVSPGFFWPVPATEVPRLDAPVGWECFASAPALPVIPTGPTGFTCLSIQLPPGETVIAWTGSVRSDVVGPITLSATAGSVSNDPNQANNATGVTEVAIGFPQATPIPLRSPGSLVLLALLVVATAWWGAVRGR